MDPRADHPPQTLYLDDGWGEGGNDFQFSKRPLWLESDHPELLPFYSPKKKSHQGLTAAVVLLGDSDRWERSVL